MSISFFLEEDGKQISMGYMSNGALEVCARKRVFAGDDGTFSFMDGKTASYIAPILWNAMATLSDAGLDTDDVFAATEGNAKRALSFLLEAAIKHPNAMIVVWR